MKRLTLILAISALLASLAVAGCVSSPGPSPTTTSTVTVNPTVTVVPTPTLIGGNDEAHVTLDTQWQTASQLFGLNVASPNDLYYIVNVTVNSDKPVYTSQDWFSLQYKVNDSAPVQTVSSSYLTPMKLSEYPTKMIGEEYGSASGDFMIELPSHMAAGYPKLEYYMDKSKQQGTYKVYTPVYSSSPIFNQA